MLLTLFASDHNVLPAFVERFWSVFVERSKVQRAQERCLKTLILVYILTRSMSSNSHRECSLVCVYIFLFQSQFLKISTSFLTAPKTASSKKAQDAFKLKKAVSQFRNCLSPFCIVLKVLKQTHQPQCCWKESWLILCNKSIQNDRV